MGLTDIYRTRIAAGFLVADARQEVLVRQLNGLSVVLNAGAPRGNGFFGKLFGKAENAPRGIYIHGEVGRGKTMLMDLFYDSVTGVLKRRVHFHAFMQDVHRARAQQKTIEQIANDIAATSQLLCLDEMQISDIADATIVGRLFEALEKRGVVLVTTANVPPDGLYKDGLNRDLFLPFIAKLNAALDVVSLDSARDYRLGRIAAEKTYLYPATAANRVAFNSIWQKLTDGAMGRHEELDVLGRKLTVPKAAHGCASFTFFELCGEALGPADYLAIAKVYRTVFLSGLPRLEAAQRNEAKRFVLLVDTLYDAHARLVILAQGPPEKIYPKGKHGFEFKRTVSRLHEMQAMSWWQGEKA